MKLPLDNSGRRFFFLTLCARERRPVFSHVVAKLDRDGSTGYTVALTPTVEATAAP